jgi:hypothetical protein
MGKKSGSRSGMNNPDNISESLETIFWVKILKFFDADRGWKKFGSGGWTNSGSGMEKIRIRDKHPGSATLQLRTRNRRKCPTEKAGSEPAFDAEVENMSCKSVFMNLNRIKLFNIFEALKPPALP